MWEEGETPRKRQKAALFPSACCLSIGRQASAGRRAAKRGGKRRGRAIGGGGSRRQYHAGHRLATGCAPSTLRCCGLWYAPSQHHHHGLMLFKFFYSLLLMPRAAVSLTVSSASRLAACGLSSGPRALPSTSPADNILKQTHAANAMSAAVSLLAAPRTLYFIAWRARRATAPAISWALLATARRRDAVRLAGGRE